MIKSWFLSRCFTIFIYSSNGKKKIAIKQILLQFAVKVDQN